MSKIKSKTIDVKLEEINLEETKMSKLDNLVIDTEAMTEVKNVKNVEKEVVETKKVLTPEERAAKKAARRAGMKQCNVVTRSDEFTEKGRRYRLCNVLPGNIEMYKSQGFVPDPQGPSHAPQDVEVGGAKGSLKAIWMSTDEENAQILDEIRDDLAREQDSQIRKNPGIPEEQTIGKITKDF